LRGQGEDRGNKVGRPREQAYAFFGKQLRNFRNGNVELKKNVKQIDIPNDLESAPSENRTKREKVD
jgi:hypothetical protein